MPMAAGIPKATAIATTASRYVAAALETPSRSSRKATTSVVAASATSAAPTTPTTRRTDDDPIPCMNRW